MNKFEKLITKAAVIDIENIDTDQIIGSDFLKITDKQGLGKHLFSDWRYFSDGQEKPDFVLNQDDCKEAQVLVAGDNFGCGSSREHAPWALLDYGIRVVISFSIADIFSNNAIKNGLLPIELNEQQHQFLLTKNASKIEIDLVNQTISCEQEVINFEIEPFAKYCLLNGIEQLDFLVSQLAQIENYEKTINEF